MGVTGFGRGGVGVLPAAHAPRENPPRDTLREAAPGEGASRQPGRSRSVLIVVENLPVPFDRRVLWP